MSITDDDVMKRYRRSRLLQKVLGLLITMATISLIYCMYMYSQVESPVDRKEDTEGWSSDVLALKALKEKRHDNQVTTTTTTTTEPNPALLDLPLNARFLDYFSINKNFQKQLSNEVTVVTMYFNIGTFQKGEGLDYFTPKLYRRWMKAFSSLQNPVIAFFDHPADQEYFVNIRRRLGPDLTKTFLLKRNQMWAFGLQSTISRIFNKVGYPKHHPNTVVAEYSSAMHAKYEIMTAMTRENVFNTRYFAWLDLGLFRSEAMSDGLPFYEIWLPPDLNASKVAYSEVFPRQARAPPQAIVYSNAVWVSGAFFIGEVHTMLKWSEQYMRATEALITNQDLMSTDQQVIYVMYNWGHPKVELQPYHTKDPKYNGWFYLGYLCKEQGDKKRHGMLKKRKSLQ